VTTDDTILNLPLCLIPRNLEIGDCFVFKILEDEKFEDKIKDIHEMQKKFLKK
jgi:hypothetical protein